MKKQLMAYMAANKYFSQQIFPFAVGVVGSINKNIALSDTIRRKNINSYNQLYEISIPHRPCFLNYSLPVIDQERSALNSLTSQQLLSYLFYPEIQDFMWQLDTYIREKQPEEKIGAAKEEIKLFFDSKKNLLLSFSSLDVLIQYITEKSVKKDISVTSSLLFSVGIPGIFYIDSDGERFIIFNARQSICINSIYYEKRNDSVLID